MNKLIVIVGFVLFSHSLYAQEVAESGWKGTVRPYLEKFLGVEKTAQFIGAKPAAPGPAELSLPELPKLEKMNTDVSVYSVNSVLRQQGKDFEALPAEKRRSYEVAFLKELFQATRRAPAREEDLLKWLNVLEGGGSREGVYRGVVLDEVYASLESFEDTPSEKLLIWTQSFTKKYLALGFSPEALKQGNLFFIKRVVSEKVLEMLDALEAKPDDFRLWYAVFSAQIGKDFPNIWPGTIRANPDAQVHIKWATKAHLQHIKSEVVIKLQTVMNGLQDDGQKKG